MQISQRRNNNYNTTTRVNVSEKKDYKLFRINENKIENIHFSFDIDSLDPLYVPGTGTPVEDGLSFTEGKEIIADCSYAAKVIEKL